MKTKFLLRFFLVGLLFISIPQLVYSQADCLSAATHTPFGTCSNTTGDLQGATNAAPTGGCGGATSSTTNGVWYRFTATAPNVTITVSLLGGNASNNLSLATTYIEVLEGTCATTLTSRA